MRALTELVGLDVNWKIDMGVILPDDAARHYVLFNADEPVVEAQAMWQRLAYFDVIMESGDGTFHAHMDLTAPARTSVAWKAGVQQSVAGFTAESENMATAEILGMQVPVFTCKGWITTANGRNLAWAPTFELGAEYVIFQPGGPALVTIGATPPNMGGLPGRMIGSIKPAPDPRMGGVPGRMIVSPEGAADPELGGLVALGFALANEQVMMLHHEQPAEENRRFRSLSS